MKKDKKKKTEKEILEQLCKEYGEWKERKLEMEKSTKTREAIINDFIDETFKDTYEFITILYGDNQDESMLSAMTEYEEWYGKDSGSITADDRSLNYLCPLGDAIYYDICELDYTPLAEQLDIDIDDKEEMDSLIWEVVGTIKDRILDYFEKHSGECRN